MRSTTQTKFPSATEAVRGNDSEQLEKLAGLAKQSVTAGNRLKRALGRQDPQAVEDALYYLSSIGSTVNSWTGK